METCGAIWDDSFVESDLRFGLLAGPFPAVDFDPVEAKYSPKAGEPCKVFAIGAPGYSVIERKHRPDDARALAITTEGAYSVYGVWGPYAEEFQLMAS